MPVTVMKTFDAPDTQEAQFLVAVLQLLKERRYDEAQRAIIMELDALRGVPPLRDFDPSRDA